MQPDCHSNRPCHRPLPCPPGPRCRAPLAPLPHLAPRTPASLAVPSRLQAFIFVLCQSSVRMVIGKLLDLGMGREFQVGGGGSGSGSDGRCGPCF